MKTEISTLVDQLLARGDVIGLRDLITELVESATLVERVPVVRSLWLRLEVTCTEEVALLARAGLLTFGPEPEPPVLPSPKERERERQRRYRERKRAAQAGTR
jgi:hypothetical protein